MKTLVKLPLKTQVVQDARADLVALVAPSSAGGPPQFWMGNPARVHSSPVVLLAIGMVRVLGHCQVHRRAGWVAAVDAPRDVGIVGTLAAVGRLLGLFTNLFGVGDSQHVEHCLSGPCHVQFLSGPCHEVPQEHVVGGRQLCRPRWGVFPELNMGLQRLRDDGQFGPILIFNANVLKLRNAIAGCRSLRR